MSVIVLFVIHHHLGVDCLQTTPTKSRPTGSQIPSTYRNRRIEPNQNVRKIASEPETHD